MTLPMVTVEMKCKHFAANGTYVALTRVEGLAGLTIVGRKITFDDFLVDKPCLQRIRAEYEEKFSQYLISRSFDQQVIEILRRQFK
jgi:hypothetical protein